MVTAEAAIAVVALAIVTGMLLQVVALVVAQLRVGDAARSAVRAVARGDTDSAAAEAARSLPGARTVIGRQGDDVVVTVTASLRAPMLAGRAVALHATARAAAEPDIVDLRAAG